MNGLADWPHFYFNVAEVGIIIGGRGRATLFPLIDVLFSTLARSLGAVTRPESNAKASTQPELANTCSGGAGNAPSFRGDFITALS